MYVDMVWACIPTYHRVREDWIGDSVSTKMKRNNKEKITQAIIGKSEDDYCVKCGHYTAPNWEERVECECPCHTKE